MRDYKPTVDIDLIKNVCGIRWIQNLILFVAHQLSSLIRNYGDVFFAVSCGRDGCLRGAALPEEQINHSGGRSIGRGRRFARNAVGGPHNKVLLEMGER
jgi:hypothetical protein